MSKREKTQADFDLSKLFEMIDEALTSKDERVQDALRGLLTIVALTRPQDDGQMAIETKHGPLRQMQEDLQNIIRRVNNLEGQIRQQPYVPPQPYAPNPGVGSPWSTPVQPHPYNPSYPVTGTPQNPPGLWWGVDPNLPHTTSKTSSSSSYTLTDNEKDSILQTSKTIKLTK